MATADWPTTIGDPSEGTEVSLLFSTTITQALSGGEQRRQRWADPRFRWNIQYTKGRADSLTDLNLLWNFYLGRKGAFDTFMFHDPDDSRLWESISVTEVKHAGNFEYWLPCHQDTPNGDIAIYVGGVLKTITTDYTLGDGGAGTPGFYRAYLDLVADPGASAITVTFTGRRSALCRFETDSMSYQAFSAALYSFGVNIVSVKGE